MLEMFDPPILSNRDVLPELPISIANRREAAALATALEREGFLSPKDVDACGHWQH